MQYGFDNLGDIKSYLGLEDEKDLDYDVVLIDIDSIKGFDSYYMREASINYFVTSFDLFSLKKGLEILSGATYDINLKKVLFTKTMSKEEDEYLNFLSQDYNIIWDEQKIYFPFEMGDQSVIMESQRVSKIKFKSLSSQYKDSLLYIVEEILADISPSELRRIMKSIEKGV